MGWVRSRRGHRVHISRARHRGGLFDLQGGWPGPGGASPPRGASGPARESHGKHHHVQARTPVSYYLLGFSSLFTLSSSLLPSSISLPDFITYSGFSSHFDYFLSPNPAAHAQVRARVRRDDGDLFRLLRSTAMPCGGSGWHAPPRLASAWQVRG